MTESRKLSFWQTLPGVLTALAAVITAITGLVVGLRQAGMFSRPAKPPAAVGSVGGAGEAKDRSTKGGSPQMPGGEVPGRSEEIDLLAMDNGGQVVVANGGIDWRRTILGPQHTGFVIGHQPEAVYSFRNSAVAEFDRFRIYKSSQDPSDVKTFQLLVGNDSPIGAFRSIGKFNVQNVVYLDKPFQEFTFTSAKGRYLKVKLLMRQDGYDEGFQIWEFQLMGRLE